VSPAPTNVTARLLELHLIEAQVRGLTRRLDEAERTLAAQSKMLADLDAEAGALRTQVRQIEAAAANDEGEVKRLDERIAKLREQMNAAKTNKEYTSFQTEISTLKADRGQVEEKALASLAQLDTIRKSMADLDTRRADRKTLVDASTRERDQRRDEIKDRLNELKAQRKAAAADVPERALAVFEQRVALGDEDVMAPLEEHDRRNREYVCGSCQVVVPMEKLNGLLGRGELTVCSSCGVILYLEAATRDAALSGKK
jgi:predicted  nucleic acid-binding Zn-ribbon protein